MRRKMEIKYADGNRGTRRERESANAVLYMRGGGAWGGGEREKERERDREVKNVTLKGGMREGVTIKDRRKEARTI